MANNSSTIETTPAQLAEIKAILGRQLASRHEFLDKAINAGNLEKEYHAIINAAGDGILSGQTETLTAYRNLLKAGSHQTADLAQLIVANCKKLKDAGNNLDGALKERMEFLYPYALSKNIASTINDLPSRTLSDFFRQGIADEYTDQFMERFSKNPLWSSLSPKDRNEIFDYTRNIYSEFSRDMVERVAPILETNPEIRELATKLPTITNLVAPTFKDLCETAEAELPSIPRTPTARPTQERPSAKDKGSSLKDSSKIRR